MENKKNSKKQKNIFPEVFAGWEGPAKSLQIFVFANASVSGPIAISSKSAALPGQTLRRQAFVPQLSVAF